MLTKIRDRHAKRILWGLVLVIVPAFVLWGGLSSLRGRQRNTIGTIDNKRITIKDWYDYIRLAQLHTLLTVSPSEKVTFQDMEALALNFLVLLHKADQENITASDKEVVAYIKANLFAGAPFDEESYENFLRYISQNYRMNLTSRAFEESIRDIIRIQKVIASNVTVSVDDLEVRALYERDTVKAKIAYLFIPYEKFKVDIGIAESALEEFYRKHKDRFAREEKIKLKYTIIPHDHPQKDEIIRQLAETKNISEICNAFSLTMKETDFMGINDPIEGVGWQPQINLVAFSLDEAAVSPPLETEKGIIIMQRSDSKPAFTPALSKIKEEVRQAYIIDAAQRDSESFSKELLDKIISSGQADLRSFAKKDRIEFATTDFFGYDDYIEGVGLNEQVSKAVFSLNNGQIYPQPLLLAKGVYIVQLLEKTAVDESDYKAKKSEYIFRLRQQREMQARRRFIRRCLEQANLKIKSLPTLQ